MKKWLQRTALTAFSLILTVGFVAYVPSIAFASQITSRSVTIGSSAASAVTTYSFVFTVPSTTPVDSVAMLACTTASGTCTTPAGFSNSSSTLTSQPTGLGATTGWTVNTATAGSLRIVNASNSTSPSGPQTVKYSTVTNPSATNATFFFRISTYSDSAWTLPIDSGTVATSTAGQVTVTASVDEAVTFTLASATVALGTLTTSTTGSGTSTMSASTNAGTGYAITYSGATLTSGANTVTGLSSATASTVNTSQFGINLVANTVPTVGSLLSGTGTATIQTGYATTNQYKFLSGDTIITATGPTNSNTFTTSYIANVSGATAAGSYSTILTYVATAKY
jgi:hypothetical protein